MGQLLALSFHCKRTLFDSEISDMMVNVLDIENFGESSQSKKPRVNWKKENVVKTFIESCLHEISVNGREGGSLKAVSWKNVAEVLQKNHNFVVEQRQMKNHYDYLKGKYGAWTKLRNKTGNVYDASTNMFNLSEEECQIEMKQNKFVEKLRTAPLPFPQLCIQLFDGVASTGVGTWGPTATVPNPSSVTPEIGEDYDTQDYYDLTQEPLPSEEEIVFRPQPQRKKQRGKQRVENEDDLARVVTHVKQILNKPPGEDEMDRCIDKLETLGWEQTPLYDITLYIFSQSTDYRKIWLRLSEERSYMDENDIILIVVIVYWYLRRRASTRIERGAIGALDGTLVHAVVPSDQQTRYRGRGRGECYQNVLAICDFNMIFTFVWAGWEGIAHDSRVLREVAFNPTSGFPFPSSNEYYLCDAAYTCTRRFMTPYRNTRYWLADFRRRRALTKEEMFNDAHAQLRNVIERAYGVLKARFPILKQMAPYPFSIQKDVVIACFAIHNFIRKCNIQDQLFMEHDENTMFTANEEQHEGSNDIEVDEMQWSYQDSEYMTSLRDQIANQLLSNISN
ncbi:uncharacterized protein LOC112516268 [Cynara cardunculus var. scolymus]|uniref:uncharacterized protein LOC112516268 n=1 Tax=Cynara cardunculus var. scolymus TaxID=59895 RepID=UPI000D62FE91|nr:uncharacterized protein LOC112516268 [Cynara cardunculus var. scolymus]